MNISFYVRRLASLAAGLLLAVLLIAGFFPLGPLPPLGPFLDPVHGVWAVARSSELPRSTTAVIPGLSGPLEVIYDDRSVPHIFAGTPEDAYRMLGYVVARDRLFQLEAQTRAAAGTLSELVGPAVLRLDQEVRRLGLAWSAERDWAERDPASEATRATLAYAEGVNAWLDQMGPEDLPVEYRLLNARPQRWQPVHSFYLLRRMGQTLAYDTHELVRERLVEAIGQEATDALFPINHPIQEPIEPGEGTYPRFDFRPLPPPSTRTIAGDLRRRGATAAIAGDGGRSQAMSATARKVTSPVIARVRLSSPVVGEGDGVGSNNWAVSPRRSATGNALLAGDPHLDLTLPSIWYEAHLVVPGHFDVYGVTIPGQPAILIGFNRDVAWSFTNTGNDVLDFYQEAVDDAAQPTQYRLDGDWRRLERRIEHYRGRRGELLAVDTIYHTHRGPLRQVDGRWLSMRWLVLENMAAAEALSGVARARTADEWLHLMADFTTPAQNGVVADRRGTIAIRSNGQFPTRPGDGLGTVIRDGGTSRSDWTGSWASARAPFARDPRQGYLASANQQPLDPRGDRGYLGANWFDPWRALRINALLRADSSVTVDAMRRYQTDPGSARTDLLMPAILEAGAAAAPGAGDGHNDELRQALRLLGEWDRRYTRDNARAVLFEQVVRELQNRIWDELRVPGEGSMGRRIATPSSAMLLQVLREPASAWWDQRDTRETVETRSDIVAQSFSAALAETRRRYGDPNAGGWRWSEVQQANISHLLRIPSFSALDLAIQGGPSTLNPSSGDGSHGASWRMVVELGPEVRAWGIYPGGQSGNPVGHRYHDRLEKWMEGELDPLFFPRSARDIDPSRVSSRLALRPTP